jgi:hypothetical protein
VRATGKALRSCPSPGGLYLCVTRKAELSSPQSHLGGLVCENGLLGQKHLAGGQVADFVLPDGEIAALAETVRIGIRLGAKVQPEWCCALGLYPHKVQEGLEVISVPARPEKSGELLRVYIHEDVIGKVRSPLRAEIEPFPVGGRQTAFENTPDGFVVGFRDLGQRGEFGCDGHG